MKRIHLKTKRLSLFPLDIQHKDAYFSLVSNNKERLKESFPITVLNTATPSKTTIYLKNLQENWLQDKGGKLGVWLDMTLIGMVMIKNIDWSIPKCELAYFVGEEFSRKGYATEAIQSVLTYCFNDLNFAKVFIRVIATNTASLALAEKCSFVREGYLKDEYRTGNKQLVDLVYFASFPNET